LEAATQTAGYPGNTPPNSTFNIHLLNPSSPRCILGPLHSCAKRILQEFSPMPVIVGHFCPSSLSAPDPSALARQDVIYRRWYDQQQVLEMIGIALLDRFDSYPSRPRDHRKHPRRYSSPDPLCSQSGMVKIT